MVWPTQLIFAYVILAAVVAVFGRKCTVGFAGIFLLSILLTPAVTALALVLTAPKSNR